MTRTTGAIAVLSSCLGAGLIVATLGAQSPARATSATWDPKAAAAYLDGRQIWWQSWPNAHKDHDTFCISCHTAMPYAISRAALRAPLSESGPSAPERKLIEAVTTRVRLWREVEPWYPDQLRGLPKTSESRGVESVMNALVLATRDAQRGVISDEGKMAFDNMWALQFKTGPQSGAWAWLNFGYEPWESVNSPAFGASLAAVAIGTAPGGYAASADLQERLKPLREYLHKASSEANLVNRAYILWASSKLPGVLSADERKATIEALTSKQQADGGWNTALLGDYKRVDNTAQFTETDGYATALVSFALQQSGVPRTHPAVARGLAWLSQHQDRTDGRWPATSPNKQRDPASEPAQFMSHAATAFAVLALTEKPSEHGTQR
jgi:squalene-hopene/tetraprenyl-beta-curcumene cyclase